MSEVPRELRVDRRRGLPDDLLFLIRKYPRDTWTGHANLGEMARFWLQRHDMFRELGTLLKTTVSDYREERLSPPDFARFFLPRLRFFLQQLHGHHQIEDLHYFPLFARAERRLLRGFDLLDSDHHVIHEALEANAHDAGVFLGRLAEGRDAALFAADAYAGRTDTLVAMLLRHLEDEEDLIVPLILERGETSLMAASTDQ